MTTSPIANSFPVAETLGAVKTFWAAIVTHLAIFFEILKNPKKAKESKAGLYIAIILTLLVAISIFSIYQINQASQFHQSVHTVNNQKVGLKSHSSIKGLDLDLDPAYSEDYALSPAELDGWEYTTLTISQDETALDNRVLGVKFSDLISIPTKDFSELCAKFELLEGKNHLLLDYTGELSERVADLASRECGKNIYYLQSGTREIEQTPISSDLEISGPEFLKYLDTEKVLVIDVNTKELSEERGFWLGSLPLSPYDLIGPTKELLDVLSHYDKIVLTTYSPIDNHLIPWAAMKLKSLGIDTLYLRNSSEALDTGVNFVPFYPARDRVIEQEQIYALLKQNDDVIFLDMRKEPLNDFPKKREIHTEGQGFTNIYNQVQALPKSKRYVTLVHNQRTAYFAMQVGLALQKQGKTHLGSNNTPFLFNADTYHDNFIHKDLRNFTGLPTVEWWYFILLGFLARLLIEAIVKFRLPNIKIEQSPVIEFGKVVIGFAFVTWHYVFISEALISSAALDQEMFLGRYLVQADNFYYLPIIAILVFALIQGAFKKVTNKLYIFGLIVLSLLSGWLITSFELLTVLYTVGLLTCGIMILYLDVKTKKRNDLLDEKTVYRSQKSALLSRFANKGVRIPETRIFNKFNHLEAYIESKACKKPVIIRSAHEKEDEQGGYGIYSSYPVKNQEDWGKIKYEVKDLYKKLGKGAQFMVQRRYKGVFLVASSEHPSVPGEMLIQTDDYPITEQETEGCLTTHGYNWYTKKWNKNTGKRRLGFWKRKLCVKLMQTLIDELGKDVSIEAIIRNKKIYLLQVKPLDTIPKNHKEELSRLVKSKIEARLFPNVISGEYGEMPLLPTTINAYLHAEKAIFAWGRVVLLDKVKFVEKDTTAFVSQTQRFLFKGEFDESFEQYPVEHLQAMLKTQLDAMKSVVSGKEFLVPDFWIENFDCRLLSPISDYDVSKKRYHETKLSIEKCQPETNKDKLHLILTMHYDYVRRMILVLAEKTKTQDRIFHYTIEQIIEPGWTKDVAFRISPENVKALQEVKLEKVLQIKNKWLSRDVKAYQDITSYNTEAHKHTFKVVIEDEQAILGDEIRGADVYMNSGYHRILPYLDSINSLSLSEGVRNSHVVMSAIEKRIPIYLSAKN